jgi:hypothetical protein
MTLKPQLAADGESHRNAADRSAAAVIVDTFVINLCSSTTPMALVHPDPPELKRFRFFVSRRLEDGRERFRLHMGHFETLEEAEDWLSVVRDIYPGAWAGETPGKRLRSSAAATAESPPSAAPPESKGAPPEESVAHIALQPPALQLPPALTTPDEFAAPEVVLPNRPSPAAPLAPSQNVIAAAPVANKQPPPAPIVAPRRDAAAALRPARPAAKTPLSNVREVLAALDERDTSPNMPTSAAPRAAAGAAQAPQTLSDTQVIQILEARRAEEPARAASADVSGGIPMLRPDDSGTRRALKEAVQDNAAVSFAVQLQWSVESMALDKVPPLAIFSAYTLYTVEGNREGRKWYGLRLGFFSDATAAKQVAQYVRSDFAFVAVVPVSPQERGRATSADRKTSAMSFAEIQPATHPEEIKLLDDESLAAPRTPVTPTGGAKTGSPAARAAATRSKTLRSKEPGAQRKGPYSLEETLEILGAGNLEIDNGRGELINESGVRHIKVEVRKNSPFQRLVARLTERVRKS